MTPAEAGRVALSTLDGVVSCLPGGGEARTGQRAMVETFARCLAEGRHLVARAGTGTGKSLGYLVPAICSGKRVVVATATKALQDQLARKDLPLLATALHRPVEFAVLKGRSNYLCRQRLAEAQAFEAAVVLPGLEEAERDRAGEAVRPDDGRNGAPGPSGARRGAGAGRRGHSEAVAQLLQWADRTKTGDLDELSGELDPLVWAAFSMAADECPGAARCPSGDDCFAESARERAASCSLVVVNQHLLGADVASHGALLGEYEALVVDEAHALEEVMSEALGWRIAPGSLRALAAQARSALGLRPSRRPAVRGAAPAAVEALLELADRLEAALSSRADQRFEAKDEELRLLLDLSESRLARLEEVLRSAAQPPARQAGAADAGGLRSARLERAVLGTSKLRASLQSLRALPEEVVAFVEGGRRCAIVVAPIDVAPLLEEALFSRRPVLLTSATVLPAHARRLGADEARTDALSVESPFPYERHGLLYCAAHLPDRRNPSSEGPAQAELEALIEAAGGRTLALFTARSAMQRFTVALRERVSWPILSQDEGSKEALLRAFTEQEGACLFATLGFWQGIDVAGPTLSCVVIDRIPFARPDDPLMAARRERAGGAAFRSIDLPRAASLLAQGAGRLIRCAEDRGVVAVLDPRLAKASYRWELVRSLPPMRRTKDRQVAEDFLRCLREARPG